MAKDLKLSAKNSLAEEDEDVSESFFGVSGAMPDFAARAGVSSVKSTSK